MMSNKEKKPMGLMSPKYFTVPGKQEANPQAKMGKAVKAAMKNRMDKGTAKSNDASKVTDRLDKMKNRVGLNY